MKNLLTAASLLTAVIYSCNTAQPGEQKPDTATQPAPQEMVARGKYLVDIMGCNDCHSPKVMTDHGPVPDTSLLLSGYPSSMPLPPIDTSNHDWVLFHPMQVAAVGPWGTSFSANLTSDESGIGNWTEAQFLKAIREGKYKGMDNTRMLLPPMPWQEYGQASDDDLKAIFAYLKSTKPVYNVVPPPVPPKRG